MKETPTFLCSGRLLLGEKTVERDDKVSAPTRVRLTPGEGTGVAHTKEDLTGVEPETLVPRVGFSQR